jgi:hypothetical protein
MKTFLLILAFFSNPIFASNHQPARCAELEQIGTGMVQAMNQMFAMNVGLRFIEKGNEPPVEYGGVMRAPNLMDANAAHREENGREILELPKPCRMSEQSLPSNELWSLIIAHEYGHKLIDRRQDQCLSSFLASKPEFSTQRQLDDIHHANCDVLALKILSHLKINAAVGIKDLGKYLSMMPVSKLGEDAYAAFLKRAAYMTNIWPTNFSTGTDFLAGEYIDGLEEIGNFLKNDRNNSHLLKDLKSRFDGKIQGCMLFKNVEIEKSISIWQQLTLSPGRVL